MPCETVKYLLYGRFDEEVRTDRDHSVIGAEPEELYDGWNEQMVRIKNRTTTYRGRLRVLAAALCGLLTAGMVGGVIVPMQVTAAPDKESTEEADNADYLAQAEARKSEPIQTDEYKDWPAGPKIGAEGAYLMEVNTGTVLYSKNADERLYPASITKMLTALVAMDKCDMDEQVKFSQAAIDSINWKEDANMGINPGNVITMEQCLYGLLVGSANEVAYAIAEHISGDGNLSGFADLMNEKARELGCTNSHFVTPNGIHDPDHYTSAHDMALIAQAFYSDELLTKMASTVSYHVPKTATQPKDDMIVYAKSKLHPGKEYAYEYLVGTKTGYTEAARQTLVSCAEHNGLKLVCVIMKEESPAQFTDTIELFDYGFNNFMPVNISENDRQYVIQSLNFFNTGLDIFGSSKAILQMNKNDYIVIPADAKFDETASSIDYDGLKGETIAKIDYYFNDVYVGSGRIEAAKDETPTFDFSSKTEHETEQKDEENVMFINIRRIINVVIIAALGLAVLFGLRALIFGKLRKRRNKRLIKKRRALGTKSLDWKDFL